MHPITAIVPTGLIYGTTNLINQHFNRLEAEKARQEQQALSRELEGSRREMQMVQMKVSVLQQQSNQAHQKALAIDHQKFQAILQKQNHEFQREIEEFRQKVNLAINERNIEFQKWRFAQEQKLQLHIVELNQQFQWEMVNTQHQNAKDLIYENYRVNKESPIINLAKDLIDAPFTDGTIPVKILFSPPELDYDSNQPQGSKSKTESYLAEAIRQFVNQGYGISSQERPTEFLDKAWQSKKYGGGAALNTLYRNLKSIPVLIFESEFAQNGINLRYCYWSGLDRPRIEGSLLTDYPYRDFLNELAKTKAREWRKHRTELIEDGFDSATIKSLAKGFDEDNLATLEEEERIIAQLKAKGKDISKFNIAKVYKTTNEDEKAFYNYLAVLHCLTIGIIADLQALQRSCTNYPLLPKLLPSLFEKLRFSSQQNQQAIAEIVKLYHQFCEGLSKQPEYNSLVPDVALDLALALCELEEKSFAIDETKYSVAQWLDLHGVEAGKVFDQENEADRKLLKSIIFQEDNAYLEKLQQVVEKIGTVTDKDFAQVQSLLEGWLNLKRWSTIPSMADVKEPEAKEKTERTSASEEKQESTKSADGLSTFSFETVTVDKEGEIIKRETKSAQYYTEILPGGVELEMVKIPGGKFTVDDKYKVNMPSFYMGKYPITQAQWKAISSVPKIEIDLASAPSCFAGNSKLPVESITWNESVEFCWRLSNITNKNYRLPSPVVWEYAARGNRKTDYHFGESINSELANIPSKESIFYEKMFGKSLGQSSTSMVGIYSPNDFGLYDIHGNVWEYCTKYWETLDDTFFLGEVWLRVIKQENYMAQRVQLVENLENKSQAELSEDMDGLNQMCTSDWIKYAEEMNEIPPYDDRSKIHQAMKRKDILCGGSFREKQKRELDYPRVYHGCLEKGYEKVESDDYYYKRSDLGFRVMSIPVRQLNCASDILSLMKPIEHI